MTMSYEGKVLSEYDLVAEEDILSVRYIDYLFKLLKNF